MKTILILTCLVALSFAVTTSPFSAKIWINEPNMINGGVRGTMHYAYDRKAYEVVLDNSAGYTYRELFDYNDAAGMDEGVPLELRFRDQYVFKDGGNCACQTGVLDHPMPILWYDTTFYKSTPLLAVKNLPPFDVDNPLGGYSGRVAPDTCASYEPTNYYKGLGTNIKQIAFDADFDLCWVEFTDGREIFFENVQFASPPTFEQPQDCVCSKPLDICVVVDRSGSLNVAEFDQERIFLKRFAEQFDLSGSAVRLSIVSFNTIHWTNLDLTSGSNAANANNAIDAMSCCDAPNQPQPDPSTGICCGGDIHGYTSVSEGILGCAEQLSTGTNAASTKIMVTITDGFHNTLLHSPNSYNFDRDFCYPDCLIPGESIVEGTPEWEACAGSNIGMCRNDLYQTVLKAHDMVPGLVSYAVGVGATVSDDELRIIANGEDTRIVKRDSFQQLADNSLEIVSRACDANDQPCGASCCGFCACGNCEKAMFCDDGVYCTIDLVPDGEVCCDTEPRPCPDTNPSNQCIEYLCFEEDCTDRPITCTGALSNCYNYVCNPADGQCVPEKKDPTAGDRVDACHTWVCDPKVSGGRIGVESVCTPGTDACKVYGCDTSNGQCTVTNLENTANLNPSFDPNDQCVTWTCDPADSDGNPFSSSTRVCAHPASAGVCKETSCFSERGCETSDRDCRGTMPDGSKATDDNLCDESYCDPNAASGDLACVEVWKVCPPFEVVDGVEDRCRPLKTSGTNVLPNNHPGRGCRTTDGVCQYRTKNCANQGCQVAICNSADGQCIAQTTAGCGDGFCVEPNPQGLDLTCGTTKCVRHYCDSSVGEANCNLSEKIIDCNEDPRITDNCLVLSTAYFPGDEVSQVNPGCDPSQADGEECIFTPVQCVLDGWETSTPSNPCMLRILDPTDPTCCVEVEKPRESTSLCTVPGACDTTTGIIPEVPKCPASTICQEVTCDSGNCNTVDIPCVSSDACVVAEACDPVTGCTFSPFVCPDADNNKCTIERCVDNNGTPECVVDDVVCDDGNPCSDDSCDAQTGECVFTTRDCNDNNACTIDSCDSSSVDGCINVPINVTEDCNDNNMCTVDTCEPDVGCVNTNIPCFDDDPCTLDVCTPFQGCQHRTIECPSYEECRVGFCDASRAQNGTGAAGQDPTNNGNDENFIDQNGQNGAPHPLCAMRDLACYAGVTETVTIAASLGTAAVVGIIVGIVLCLALGGGGVWAVYQRGGISSVNTTMNNPLYKGDGGSGVNPLYANR